MGIKRLLLRGVLGVVRRPVLTLTACAAVLGVCVFFAATRLSISTNQNDLFNPDVPFFRDYLDFSDNFPENEAVYVVVRPAKTGPIPAVERWTGLADAVAARLAALHDAVASVDAKVPTDKLGDQGLLFDTPRRVRGSVEDVREFLPLVKAVVEPGVLKSAVLGDTPLERLMSALQRAPDDAESNAFLSLLAGSWLHTLAFGGDLRPGAGLPDFATLDAADPSRRGYYYVRDAADPAKRLLLVRVAPKIDYASLSAVSQTIDRVAAAVREAAKPFPEFTVGLTGRPALDAAEMSTTDRDTRKAEILAASAVFVGLVVALRSVWLALAGELALGVGIGWTFGWATLSVGQLNLLSLVFLLALIGIGMDYLVQILTRYRVESDRRRDPKRVWVAVFRHVSMPINTACLGAAGAFLVSALTDFRGAAQLGIIAGGGLLLCLAAGYTALPALLTLLPARRSRRRPRRERAEPPRGRWRYAAWPAVWLGLLGAGLPYAARTRFDPDILGLQSPGQDAVRLVRHLQTWSAVVLSDDVELLRKVEAAVIELPTVQTTESVLNALDNLSELRRLAKTLPAVRWTTPQSLRPGDLTALGRSAAALAKKTAAADTALAAKLTQVARLLSDPDAGERALALDRLNAWQSGFLRQLRDNLAAFRPAGLDVDALPAELRQHYVARDGRYALYIYPNADLWEQANLNAFARDVERAAAAVPGAPAPTGIAINIHHSTAAIERSFYHATAYALGLIVLLVWLDLRRVGLTLLAVSVLAFGLPMLVVLMGLLHVNWNFANFFALPILIGAGHEYGVFLVHRYLEARDYPSRTWGRVDVSDRALLLCAYVTCSSFGFFWLVATHQGLRSLGLVMTLGTACIYLASLCVLRPLLKWRLAAAGRDAGPPRDPAAATATAPADRARQMWSSRRPRRP